MADVAKAPVMVWDRRTDLHRSKNQWVCAKCGNVVKKSGSRPVALGAAQVPNARVCLPCLKPSVQAPA